MGELIQLADRRKSMRPVCVDQMIAIELATFYVGLLAKQQQMGAEFQKVLFDNLWELYAR